MHPAFRRPDGVYEIPSLRRRRLLLRLGEILLGLASALALAASFALNFALGAVLAAAAGAFFLGRLLLRLRAARLGAGAPRPVRLRVVREAPDASSAPRAAR